MAYDLKGVPYLTYEYIEDYRNVSIWDREFWTICEDSVKVFDQHQTVLKQWVLSFDTSKQPEPIILVSDSYISANSRVFIIDRGDDDRTLYLYNLDGTLLYTLDLFTLVGMSTDNEITAACEGIDFSGQPSIYIAECNKEGNPNYKKIHRIRHDGVLSISKDISGVLLGDYSVLHLAEGNNSIFLSFKNFDGTYYPTIHEFYAFATMSYTLEHTISTGQVVNNFEVYSNFLLSPFQLQDNPDCNLNIGEQGRLLESDPKHNFFNLYDFGFTGDAFLVDRFGFNIRNMDADDVKILPGSPLPVSGSSIHDDETYIGIYDSVNKKVYSTTFHRIGDSNNFTFDGDGERYIVAGGYSYHMIDLEYQHPISFNERIIVFETGTSDEAEFSCDTYIRDVIHVPGGSYGDIYGVTNNYLFKLYEFPENVIIVWDEDQVITSITKDGAFTFRAGGARKLESGEVVPYLFSYHISSGYFYGEVEFDPIDNPGNINQVNYWKDNYLLVAFDKGWVLYDDDEVKTVVNIENGCWGICGHPTADLVFVSLKGTDEVRIFNSNTGENLGLSRKSREFRKLLYARGHIHSIAPYNSEYGKGGIWRWPVAGFPTASSLRRR
jgi:hypothetical protein